jgi:hypothetical protein
MDPRLNLAMLETHEAELARRAARARVRLRWPDDGRPPRPRRRRRAVALHPTAVLASILTWR